MNIVEATSDEVVQLILALPNKGNKLKSIPTSIYKSISIIVPPIICELFNSSVREGVFPDVLKLAEIIPVHKKGSPTLRPFHTDEFLLEVKTLSTEAPPTMRENSPYVVHDEQKLGA